MNNVVKLCMVKHEVGDAFLISVPSVQEVEAFPGFRELLSLPGVFIVQSPGVFRRKAVKFG